MSEKYFLDVFLNCKFNASAGDTLNPIVNVSRARGETTRTEIVATILSLLICISFLSVYFLRSEFIQLPQQYISFVKARKCLRAMYRWDEATWIFVVIALLTLLQGMSFFLSAGTNDPFQPMQMSNESCRAQGILFQFSTNGLNGAVIAEIVVMYMVLVKSVSLSDARRLYQPWLLALVVFVGVASVAVPLILEATLGIEIFTKNTVAGLCWLNTQCDAIMYTLFFSDLEVATFLISLVLGILIIIKLCAVYASLRSQAKLPFWLYIARRIMFLVFAFLQHCINASYFFGSLLIGNQSEYLHDTVSFLVHAPGVVYLVAFLIPDAAFILCMQAARRRNFYVPHKTPKKKYQSATF